MAWFPQQRWSHPTLKDRVFDIFHSGVPVHVVNLSQNQLTPVTGISSAPKWLNLDRIKKLYLLHNPIISGNIPSDIGNMNGLVELDMSFTSLHGNIHSKFGILRDLLYLGMDDTHIPGPIPTDLYNIQ